MSRVRAAARAAAYSSGALGARHRLAHRATLTVAMFHRVVLPGTPADPVFSLSADMFAGCLDFFRRHYAVIGLDRLLDPAAPLPPRALLISFDDGWRDTATVALPLLRAAGLPAVVFLATDALADPQPWWQEILLRALREGRADAAELWNAAGPPAPLPRDAPDLPLLLRYAALDPPARRRALAAFVAPDAARDMLAPADLPALAAAGIAVGGHGAAHLPLSLLADPAADLRRCRAALGPGPAALSFPHGRYDAGVVAAARAAGFRPLFTSDACLNAAPGGRAGALLGRIVMQPGPITHGDGRLDPARLAAWLFHRPVRALG